MVNKVIWTHYLVVSFIQYGAYKMMNEISPKDIEDDIKETKYFLKPPKPYASLAPNLTSQYITVRGEQCYLFFIIIF